MVDVTVDEKPMAKLPYDPNDIPEAVKKRAAAVDALYKQQPSSNGSDGQPAAGQPSDTPESPVPPTVDTPTPQTSVSSPDPGAALASAELSSPSVDDENSDSWKLRYERMHGRYNASQKTIGEMQEQMNQMGNELLQHTRSAPQSGRSATQPSPQRVPTYLTEEDVKNYGGELIDVTQRAALHAVAPELEEIKRQNAELQRRIAVEARKRLDDAVETAVPNYREIDRDPRWRNWLLGVDVLSGRVRQQLLNEAISAAQAQRAISFFKGFLAEEEATGHIDSAPPTHQPAAPRVAAMDLRSIAAPGRARPATGGDPSLPPEKPIYSHAQIRQLYEQHRKGAYLGRETEWAQQEADIFAAGREGRVR